MIGETLKHYRILEQIGAGGMGAVYRAEDLQLRREVALKVLPTDVTDNADRLDRFLREARSAASLNHPNIVTLFSVEQADDRHFLTMELVKGQPLGNLIPRGGFNLNRFLELAIALADAVAAAHEKGITHRDLKPANVMIDDAGRLKVIDFGLAKATNPGPASSDADAPTQLVTMEGRIMGTPAYMAPEQVEGRAVDHRADLFALGILYHEMLTGELPFKGASNMSVMSAILRDEPASISSLRPEVPTEISRLIRRCLQKHPNERAQSALDIRNELKELQKEFVSGILSSSTKTRFTPPPAAPATAPPQTTNPRRFGPRQIAIAAGLALVATALLMWKGPGRLRQAADNAPAVAGRFPVPTTIPRITRLTATERLETMPVWSPDGQKIAFIAQVGNVRQVFVRDMGSAAAVQVTRDDYDHIHPAWGPDTNTLYYARSREARETITLGDGQYGAYEPERCNIVRHELASGDHKVILQHCGYPTVAPGGSALFFVREHRIYRSDLFGARHAQLTEDADTMNHIEPKVSFDGSRIAFRRLNFRERAHHIAVVTTNRVMTLVRTNGLNLSPSWHPSGTQLFFSNYRGSGLNIWRIPLKPDNTAASEPVPVTVGGGHDLTPAFSPDGRHMAFAITSQNADVYRIAMDPVAGTASKSPAERLPFNSNSEDGRASWAPQPGPAMLAFNSDRDGDMNIYIWREADNSVTRVTTGPGGDYQPTWSPDMKQIVFFSSRHGNAEIYVTSTNALSTPVRLTHNPGIDYNPFFSPDGKRILFASERQSSVDLWLMKADGSDQRLISGDAYITHFHVWYDNERLLNLARIKDQGAYCYISVADGRIEQSNMIFPVPRIGGHGSLSPDRKFLMDLDWEHAHIWVLPVHSNSGQVVYAKPNPAATLDYPWWSPDGRWATFDFMLPRNSEIYLADWDVKDR